MEITTLANHLHESKTIAQWIFDEWGSESTTFESVHEKILLMANKGPPLILLAKNNNELMGSVELKFFENPDYKEYKHWLGGLYVSSDFRRQGVANQLINEVKLKMSIFNIKKLYLQTEKKNIQLYQKHGFKIIHDTFHQRLNVDISIMVFDINHK